MDLDSHFRGDAGLVYTVMSENPPVKGPLAAFDNAAEWQAAALRCYEALKVSVLKNRELDEGTTAMAGELEETKRELEETKRKLEDAEERLNAAEGELKKYRAAGAAEAASIIQNAFNFSECDDGLWSWKDGDWWPAEEEEENFSSAKEKPPADE